jgi:hypothetical protein
MGKVAYITRCILMDNLHIPSSGLTTTSNDLVNPSYIGYYVDISNKILP